jgi:transcriptional regulator with XRE-family HTH domain
MLLYPRFAGLLAERDLTYTDLAAAVGVTPAAISFMIRGRMSPSVLLKARCAEALDVSEEELFRLAPEMEELVKMARKRGLVDDPVVLLKAVS